MRKAKPFLSVKYQVLIALAACLVVSFVTFYLSARRVIVADKKLLIRDLNLALMDGTYGAVTKAIVQRATELVQVVASEQIAAEPKEEKVQEFFKAFRPPVAGEIFRASFYKKEGAGEYLPFSQYINFELVKSRGYGGSFFSELDAANGIDAKAKVGEREGIQLSNYSGKVQGTKGQEDFFGLSLFIPARAQGTEDTAWLARIDLDQQFLIQTLQSSDLSEIFLVDQRGKIICHSEPSKLLVPGVFQHPLIPKLREVTRQSESTEVNIDGTPYFASIRDAGFPGLFLVSQIPASELYHSLRKLLRSTLVSATFILYLAFIASLVFANRFTAGMKRLAFAAREIGRGNFKAGLVGSEGGKISDEVSVLSSGFDAMAEEIQQLLVETAEKSRMENELVTVSLLQSTVLIAPEVQSQELEVSNCYIPATECSGDFIDAFVVGRKIYFAVADATGHGASAALVTGVAKSCLLTLRLMNAGAAPSPDQVLSSLNRVLFEACKGKLLMTMCMIQLDVDTGEILLSNAGHESPLCIRKEVVESGKGKAEEFFARGERLGFAAESVYSCERYSISAGDCLLLYTDGITEAKDGKGAEWGERQVKKSLKKALSSSASLSTAKEELLKDLRSFTSDEPLHDDVTFSLLRLRKAA